MASMALSRRLLVLTGRFSLLRAGYATHPSFVEQVEHDSVPHWRFGSLPLVTGDDKSTWFWLLKRKVPMLYLPDVTVWSLETPAATSFIAHSVQMMRRWFGNMLRTSGRALKLGTRTVPVFTWFSLLDQRVSMWTSLAAPAAVGLMTALQGNKTVLYGYLLWVLVSRFVYALLLGISQGRLRSVWPFLLYWNQIAGSLVKIHTLFHLARQHWNRQRVRGLLPEPEQKYIGNVFEVTAMLTFVYWVALMVGLADAPGF
jgi:glycosyltransferase Alg8